MSLRKLILPIKCNVSNLNYYKRFFSRNIINLNNNVNDNLNETHFGFKTVNVAEKQTHVNQVFETVASKYDLMNDVMSMGIHRLWKDLFIERLSPMPGTKLLDMAGGTGDIAFRYIKYLKNLNINDIHSFITISDINKNMLEVGQNRANNLEISNLDFIHIDWVCANAEQLPFDDNSFNAYTIAFGIRNCTYIDKVLAEAYRVLKPGGRFMCLEFSQLPNNTLQWIYDQYSFQVIPPLGELFAGQWQPYQYLVESIRKFPDQENFKKMIETAGFEIVTYENLSFGICAIHSGFKL